MLKLLTPVAILLIFTVCQQNKSEKPKTKGTTPMLKSRNGRLKPFNIHDFRRTAAVNLLEAGVDIKTVAELGGWKELDTLCERYLPLSRSHVQSAVEKVDFDLRSTRKGQGVDTFVDTPQTDSLGMKSKAS